MEIQPVHPKGDQSWVFIGRTDSEAETLILWPLHVKSWLIGKDPDAGKDWEQEEKGTTEAGSHHQFNGHGFGWTPRVGDGQGGLVCCDSWGCKESDTTEWLTELNWILIYLSLKDIEESKTTVMAKAIIKNTLSAIFNPSVVFKQSCEHATSHLYLAIAVSSVAE